MRMMAESKDMACICGHMVTFHIVSWKTLSWPTYEECQAIGCDCKHFEHTEVKKETK